MEIKLISLEIHNFKGVKDFKLDPNGHDIRVFGKNATGKTTLFDAFTWLLFGKNSGDVTKFNAKPLDSNNQEIIGAEPLVEAILEIDSVQHTFRRELKENWVQPKGQLERTRKSDITQLMIDSIPKKVGEYQTAIKALVDEELFRLITDPAAFNRLDMKNRRKILLDLFSDLTDQEVIDSDENLKGLTEILDGHSISDTKESIKFQRKELKKKIDGIPARIDEAERAKPELMKNTDRHELAGMKEVYQDTVSALQEQISHRNSLDADVDRSKQIEKLKLDLTIKQRSYQESVNLQLSGLRTDVNKQQDIVNELHSQLMKLTNSVQLQSSGLERLKSEKQNLLDQYHYEKNIAFNESDLICPTCHQPLQEGEAENLRKEFNVNHSTKLAELIKDGKQTAQDIAITEAGIKQATVEKDSTNKNYLDAQKRLMSLQDEYNKANEQVTAFEDTDDYASIMAQIKALESADKTEINSDHLQELQTELESQQAGLAQVNAELSKIEQVEIQETRIEELKQEEVDLKATAQKLDGQDYLLQEFTRVKAHLLEDKINSLFKKVNFKLFDVQKNGEIKDVAEATVNGVPYSTDLNSGAKINAGLDIINVLSEKYHIEAPIFIDNAESVNDIMPTEAQQIALIVSEDEQLRVEEK